MANQFKEGDVVKFKNQAEQKEHEKDNSPPFSVESSKKKDIYDSGLSEECCWEEIVSVRNAKGEVFTVEEADNLCKI